ncbi:MAG: hypothetical protein US50_C0039G0014 [Candidatus Nomurabacteria bacterium GW2011_GWB1_37_5]|uniref:Carbonic anhydrase n=1 Tax=Candidatus Nomurabacteria bacterium GW2011_GWB1_37_5 TaxID=1618742 RepID=A0A0G0GUP3_9BACT|nr:MAG: hypothetical protein US50_C0039G0014 [Candidatus Nomurabacteria bacterium GW2011_GWB1_37_5]
MNLTSIIEHASPKERYQADACIIWCLDNRFHGLLNKFIKLRGYKNCDLVNVTGGAKDLVGNEKRRKNYLFSQIERSISFHGTKKVILMIHSDCAAYEQEIKKTSTEKLFLISEIVRTIDGIS